MKRDSRERIEIRSMFERHNVKGTDMTDMLQEYCDSRGVAMRVDRQAGLIRGVKVLGLRSRNGRAYLPEALDKAVPLYEGAKVNVNHPRGNPGGPRDYQDRIGAIRNVVVRTGEGLFADFHFNPKHALAEQLAWDAEHAPENVGFSHNVEARCARQGEQVVVEAITRVQSVDLVADPATTRGLFESNPDGSEEQRELSENSADDAAAELRRLREEVDRFRAAEALRRKRDAALRLLGECKLSESGGNDPLLPAFANERFVEFLLAAPDERTMRAMVEERAELVRIAGGARTRPQSMEQHRLYAVSPNNAKSFAEAIT
ncbi:MAG: hypothetical protein JW959_01750 [Pirellulales bacterium]|nr:hypothetical protein [Pirellulales bacterium]